MLDGIVPAMNMEPHRELGTIQDRGAVTLPAVCCDVGFVLHENAQAVPFDVPEVAHRIISEELAG